MITWETSGFKEQDWPQIIEAAESLSFWVNTIPKQQTVSAVCTTLHAFALGPEEAMCVANNLVAATDNIAQLPQLLGAVRLVAPVAAFSGWAVGQMCSRISEMIRQGYTPAAACSHLRRYIGKHTVGCRQIAADYHAGSLLDKMRAARMMGGLT